MPALSPWWGIRKSLEDASDLPFLPVGIRERAGLLPWGNDLRLRYVLGLMHATGFGSAGIWGLFGE